MLDALGIILLVLFIIGVFGYYEKTIWSLENEIESLKDRLALKDHHDRYDLDDESDW